MKSKIIIDVGGTKTRFVLLTPDGKHHKKKEISSQPNHLKTDIKGYLHYIKLRGIPLQIGIRGVWTKSEREYWKKKLRPLSPQIKIQSDMELAYELIFGSRHGILLNAGTGSMAYGRNKKGEEARSGGLGPILGDEGSGFWIGKRFLQTYYEETGNYLMVRKYAKDPNYVSKISELGFQILKEAQTTQSHTLNQIIKKAQDELLLLMKQVLRELKWKGPFELALRGGLFENLAFKKRFIFKLDREKFEFSLKSYSA